MTDSTVNELLEVLKESREYMRYFGELGVENVAVPTGKAVESSTVARAALTAEPSAQPKARTALLRGRLASVEVFWRLSVASGSADTTAPSETALGGLSAVVPSPIVESLV